MCPTSFPLSQPGARAFPNRDSPVQGFSHIREKNVAAVVCLPYHRALGMQRNGAEMTGTQIRLPYLVKKKQTLNACVCAVSVCARVSMCV